MKNGYASLLEWIKKFINNNGSSWEYWILFIITYINIYIYFFFRLYLYVVFTFNFKEKF